MNLHLWEMASRESLPIMLVLNEVSVEGSGDPSVSQTAGRQEKAPEVPLPRMAPALNVVF